MDIHLVQVPQDVEVVNVRRKTAKKMTTSRILFSPLLTVMCCLSQHSKCTWLKKYSADIYLTALLNLMIFLYIIQQCIFIEVI